MEMEKSDRVEIVGFVMVLLMAVLQGFYAVYAYLDPIAFSELRGTSLLAGDEDWVQVYASRTLFIALLIGCLLYLKHYKILMLTALLGIVMPLTDGVLAYMSLAPTKVVTKHALTVIYLLVTSFVLYRLVYRQALDH